MKTRRTCPEKPPICDLVALVVTHNRKHLLLNCLDRLVHQSHQTDVLIVDNASTDGTGHELHSQGWMDHERIHYICLEKNTGGAGGFHYGIKHAMQKGWKWFWLMDDDAIPEVHAMAKLLRVAKNSGYVYGSAAVYMKEGRKKLCWPVFSKNGGSKRLVQELECLGETTEVFSLPFLGLLIHRELTRKIGLPEKDFFLYGDDLEYCLRARMNASKIILVKNSLITHPAISGTTVSIMNRELSYRRFSKEKSYYETRNKILIAKQYLGLKLWTETLPGIFFRMVLALAAETQPKTILKVYAQAVGDGIRGKVGEKRWE
jgi:rhamnopyranosyl-N-acetylglucosaminyl-diphospho-decaprenol beta-1,3/1,4-galactofuranosyltransferase